MAAISLAVPRPRTRLHGLSYQWQALLVVIIGTFMVMLDTTIVNIALPRIITVFGAAVDTAQFVLTGYMLALAIVMPATGYLSDTFGTKRVYFISILFFTIGSALCGLAWNVGSLIAFRVLQGLGGGMLMPLGTTIIFKVVPAKDRGAVMGIFGLPMLLAPVIGPTFGGYLVEYVDWRVIFTLNIPVGILGLLLCTLLLRETDTRPNLRFDRWGFVLSGSGFALLLYGLARAPTDGWTSLNIVLELGVGSVLMLLWIFVELTERQPLLELRVFKNYTFTMATLVSFVITLGMFSSMFLLPLFLQNFRGLGAMESGVLMFPQALASGLLMPISGRLFDKVGPRPLITTGLLILGISTFQLSKLDVTTPNSTITAVLILRGFGMGLAMMPSMTTAMNTLVGPLVARGSALTNVLRQLFGAFGTAIFATLLASRQTYHTAMLAQTVTPDSIAVRRALQALAAMAMQHGLTAAQGQMTGMMLLGRQLALTAAIKSFDDCFLISAAVCVVGVLPALLLRSKGVSGRQGARQVAMD
jgi:DHA2 family multidrug resistance protein